MHTLTDARISELLDDATANGAWDENTPNGTLRKGFDPMSNTHRDAILALKELQRLRQESATQKRLREMSEATGRQHVLYDGEKVVDINTALVDFLRTFEPQMGGPFSHIVCNHRHEIVAHFHTESEFNKRITLCCSPNVNLPLQATRMDKTTMRRMMENECQPRPTRTKFSLNELSVAATHIADFIGGLDAKANWHGGITNDVRLTTSVTVAPDVNADELARHIMENECQPHPNTAGENVVRVFPDWIFRLPRIRR